MKKFILSNWQLVLITILSVFIVWPLFVPGYFSHHDDLQVMRIFEMRKCFADFQIPCRWVPDMGYGNGYPIFNFYGVFPYYLGTIASFVLGYIGAAKLLFFLPLILGGIGMYLLSKELFGKIPGFVGGVLYLFAPYRALDSYVRGAVGESFALAIVPFVFYFFLKLVKLKDKKYFTLATISTALLFVSHNIMTLIFTPVVLSWIIFWLYKEKWMGTRLAILSLIISFGLASFFLLPAFMEKRLVQTESLTRNELDFRAQFVKVSQLFLDRSWNYAGSAPQSANTISYQIGWPHWWLVALSFLVVILSKKQKNISLFAFLFLVFTFGVYMTHNKSSFIWESIKILSFVQFPWRFLSIVIFSGSLLGAYFLTFFRDSKWLKVLSILIVILTVILNWQYFRPEHFYKDVTDLSKLSGQNFVDQQKGSLLDYLPKTALEPRQLPPNTPYVVTGSADISYFENRSNSWLFKVVVNKEAQIEVPVFDFPNWRVFVNDKEIPHTNKNVLGRIGFTLPVGEFAVRGRFLNTPIRTFGNILTIASLLALVLIYAKGRKIFV